MAEKPSLLDRVMEPPPQASEAPAGGDALLEQVLAPPPPPTFGERLMQGITDPLYGGAQAMSHAFPGFAQSGLVRGLGNLLGMGEPNTPQQMDAKVARREADYQARRRGGGATGIDWVRMGGNVAGTLPLAVAGPAGSLPRAVAGGAMTGAISGALTPVTEGDFAEEKGKQVVFGTATGGLGGAAGHVLGRLLAPRPDPAVRTLREAGVDLTPGQAAGGIVKAMEDRATSIPIAGDIIRGAQRQSIESFNRAVANRVLEPLDETLPSNFPVGRDLVQEVEQRITDAYARAASKARPFGPDAQFAADIQREAQRFLTPSARQTFIRTLRDKVVSRLGQGPIDGETFKTVDSELGAMARPYLSAASPAERELGQAVQGVQKVLRDLIARQNPQAAPLFRRADAAFARFVRLQRAAGAQGSTGGVFSPQQFSNAVRASDNSVRKGAFARGDALMQDLSDAGRAVLPNSIPNSGTPERLMAAGTMLGGAGAAGMLPHLGVLSGVTGAVYSPLGRYLTTGLLAGARPAPIDAAGALLARSGGAVALPATGLLTPMLLPPIPKPPDEAR